MNCPRCSSANPEGTRFCHRCGESLSENVPRHHHYAANPNEPVRALAVISTLMPHVSGSRHHLYRAVLALALLATVIAGAFGALAVALFCAAIALPLVLFLYQYDHDVWQGEPLLAVGIGVAVAVGAGIGIGFLANAFSASTLGLEAFRQLPDAGSILELGLALPVLAFVVLALLTGVLTSRPSFSHALDAVNFGALVGAALAIGESLTVQHNAFTISINASDSARDTMVALTLGFVKPLIYATAAALPGLSLRRPGTSAEKASGFALGALLVVLFDLSVVLLAPYSSRGIVLTLVVAAAIAGIGLLAVRSALHDSLVSEAFVAVQADRATDRIAEAGAPCAHCEHPLPAGAAFCPACGSAVAAMPR
ncbi:MAG: zinc ribbon domain-containing protein, partial [Acidimicrobiales bacterium]